MHILIAPDSFKESLSALEVAKSIQNGFRKALPNATFDLMPVGDGGEGTLEALTDGLHLKRETYYKFYHDTGKLVKDEETINIYLFGLKIRSMMPPARFPMNRVSTNVPE